MVNEYYIIENGEPTGPFLLEELQERQLTLDTQVSSAKHPDWQPAADLPELTPYFYEQGIYLVSEENLAGFWWRLLAYLFDNSILYLPIIGVGRALQATGIYSGLRLDNASEITDINTLLINNLIVVLVVIVYNAIFEATPMRGSVGKYIFRLAVVNSTGQRESFGQALIRNLSKIISSLIFCIGYLSIFWDPYQQTWHDKLAKAYVIRKPIFMS